MDHRPELPLPLGADNEHLQSRSIMHMSPSCRDKGWMRGREGAWCLSWWPDAASWGGEARGSHPDEDRHQAPASAPLLPCPYSEGRGQCPPYWGAVAAHDTLGSSLKVMMATEWENCMRLCAHSRLCALLWLGLFLTLIRHEQTHGCAPIHTEIGL
jgi:hypothetical protein